MKEPIGRSEISKYLALPDLEWCMRKSLTEKSIIILSLLLSKEGTPSAANPAPISFRKPCIDSIKPNGCTNGWMAFLVTAKA
jgi:hypothetical protein